MAAPATRLRPARPDLSVIFDHRADGVPVEQVWPRALAAEERAVRRAYVRRERARRSARRRAALARLSLGVVHVPRQGGR